MDKKIIYGLVLFGLLFLFTFFYWETDRSLSGFASKESIITTIQLEQDYSELKEGDTNLIGITLIRLGGEEKKDYVVTMFLEDENGLKTGISSQTIAVETRASLVMELNIPKDSDSKSYTLSVEVRDINDDSLISKTS